MRFVLVLVALFSSGLIAQAEEIALFEAEYTIESDGVVQVEETVLYDFAETPKHGLYRTLKTSHPQSATVWYKNRFVEITDIAVLRNGVAEPFVVDKYDTDVRIKIGDAEHVIQGEHTYTIAYVLRGALSYGSLGSELYWNATGNEWEVPIQTAKVSIIGAAQTGTVACYEGYLGSTDACTESVYNNATAVYVSGRLDPGAGLTVATALNQDQVAVLVREKITFVIPLGMVMVWWVGLGWYLWRWRHQNDVSKPVIAQYEPYRNYLPTQTGVLLNNSLDAPDLAAGIVYLAEQGFITIKQIEKKQWWIFSNTDYEFTLVRPISDCAVPLLQILLRELLFFATHEVGSVSHLSGIAVRQVENAALIQKLQTEAVATLRTDGYLETAFSVSSVLFGIMAVQLIILWVVSGSLVWPVVCGLVSLLFVFAANSRRRTAEGYIALNHILGFKLFLSVTDAERFKFHNAPDKNPALFMKYLPYAVALGVEKEWALVFADITLPAPSWFAGTDAFTATAFANELSSFATSLSSSSGTQGSSGGGSSGGGGGGGGGGSW